MNLLITQGLTSRNDISKDFLSGQNVLFSLDPDFKETAPEREELTKDLENRLYECWQTCRDLLADYTASIQNGTHPFSEAFRELGTIDGLPIWHLTGLGKRDPEVRRQYFCNLTYLYFINGLRQENYSISVICTDMTLFKAIKANFPDVPVLFHGSSLSTLYHFLKSLRQGIGTLAVLLLTRLFLSAEPKGSIREPRSIFFLSIHPISWIPSPEGGMMDRHYSTSTFRDTKFNLSTCFLIYPWPNFRTIFNFGKYLSEFKAFCSQIPRSYSILSWWSFKDLLGNLTLQTKFLFRLRAIPQKAFYLSGLNVDAIIRPLISDCLYNGDVLRISMQNFALLDFLRKNTSDSQQNILITYSQLFPESRLLAASLPPKWKLLTIQHAVEYKNKFSNYFHKSQLETLKLPDTYFVQGDGYAQLLESYFPPERIKTIGSLKYDLYFDKIHQSSREHKSTKTLLIAPSLEDAHIILPFFKDLQLPAHWKVLLKPHPALDKRKYQDLVRNSSIPIEVVQTPIWDLLNDVDLVVFNYSSVGLEAAFWGLSSVRLSSKKVFEIFDPDTRIPCFYTPQDLSSYLAQELPESSESTIRFYFHKFDGLCYQRFWSEIQKEVQKNET